MAGILPGSGNFSNRVHYIFILSILKKKTMNQIKIKNTIAILNKYNGIAFEKVMANYPEIDRQILFSEKYGETNLVEEEGIGNLQIELTICSLKETKKRVLPNIERLKKRLKKAKNFRMIASIVATISSVGLIGLIIGTDNNLLALIAALINLASSVCVIVADNMETPSIGGTSNLLEIYQKYM